MECTRGFDRPMALVFLSLLSTCAAGGFVWQWSAQGQTCTAACSDVGLVCVKEFSKIGSQAAFVAASDGSVSCTGGYSGAPYSWTPGKEYHSSHTGGSKCFWQSGFSSTCTASSSSVTRLCSCQCPAGSFSLSDTQPYPCTRYDTIPILPFHLRLRKARPKHLFLSSFLSP